MKNIFPKPVILLDMDEVLVDFVGGVYRMWGVSREEVEALRTPGEWCVLEPLEKAVNQTLGIDGFWDAIHAVGSEFWEALDPLPWADELIELVESWDVPWYVVTAPSDCPTSYNGKVRWLKARFGSRFDRFIISPHKELLAQPGRVLIDDREENVHKFTVGSDGRPTGGAGIIFPSRGNSLHKYADDPLRLLTRRVETVLQRRELCI